MIRNFGDHAANERTFLVWVRTAIAVMAFGFLVEKFDLFLEIAAPSLSATEGLQLLIELLSPHSDIHLVVGTRIDGMFSA